MFDLDAAAKIPQYELKYKNTEHTFDPIIVTDKMARDLQGETDPAKIRDKLNLIFGLDFNTGDALLVLRDFQEFAQKFEAQLKNLFGRSQSSSTTTESDPQNTNG